MGVLVDNREPAGNAAFRHAVRDLDGGCAVVRLLAQEGAVTVARSSVAAGLQRQARKGGVAGQHCSHTSPVNNILSS